jgi:hypothetical protein
MAVHPGSAGWAVLVAATANPSSRTVSVSKAITSVTATLCGGLVARSQVLTLASRVRSLISRVRPTGIQDRGG